MACLRLAVWALAAALPAAPESVPAPAQATLLLKVLTADRNLVAQGRGQLAIAIVFQGTLPASREAAGQFAAGLERANAAGGTLPVRYGLVDVSDPAALERGVEAIHPGVLWVAPLAGVDVARIAALARARKIRTATGVPSYVDLGLSVGFESHRGGVRIVINREASRAEGADFSSKLLKLARQVP